MEINESWSKFEGLRELTLKIIFLQRVQYGRCKLAQSLQAISEVKRCKKLGWNANFIWRQQYQREIA